MLVKTRILRKMANAGKDLRVGECVMLEKVDADRLVSFGSAEYVVEEQPVVQQKEEKQGYQTKEEKQAKTRKTK